MESDIEIFQDYANKTDENIINIKKKLKDEINKIILDKWSFLGQDWKKNTKYI